MLVVRSRFIPIGRRYSAINLLGIVVAKPTTRLTARLLNHERIHSRQMAELLVVGFYLLYLLEWSVRLIQTHGNNYAAYRRISFERESYTFDSQADYLNRRRIFAQWRKYSKQVK